MTNTAGRKMMKQMLVILIMVCMAAAVSLMNADSIHAAATSPSAAPTISMGQKVSGSFTKDERLATHYYKFRTGSSAGQIYTLKGECTPYCSNANNQGVNMYLLDSNYNYILTDRLSSSIRMTGGSTGSTTFRDLKTNTVYYVMVEHDWAVTIAHQYNFTVTSSGNGTATQTPSIVTPSLKVDKTRIVSAEEDNVYVTGTVSYAAGQMVGVYDADARIMYNYVQLGSSYGKESFRIQVPKRYISEKNFAIKATALRNIVNPSNTVKVTVTIGSEGGQTGYIAVGTTVGGSQYELIGASELGGPKATLIKAKNAKTVTIPATIKYAGTVYKVKGIKAGAFKKSKAKTVIIKSKKLSGTSVRNSLKDSKVKTIKVKVGSKTQNKKYVKIYKKYFSKANCGKKIKVK